MKGLFTMYELTADGMNQAMTKLMMNKTMGFIWIFTIAGSRWQMKLIQNKFRFPDRELVERITADMLIEANEYLL